MTSTVPCISEFGATRTRRAFCNLHARRRRPAGLDRLRPIDCRASTLRLQWEITSGVLQLGTSWAIVAAMVANAFALGWLLGLLSSSAATPSLLPRRVAMLTEPQEHCAVYYVDSNQGADTACGCAPGAAWRSLFRLRQQRLRPGDSVLFVRGGRWRGFLIGQGGNETHGPVTYGAYGDPRLPKPLLMGSVRPQATDWRLVRSNVWAANISELASPLVASNGATGNEVTDVGHLVRVTTNDSSRSSRGVTNEEEQGLGRKVWSPQMLQNPFDFYFDRAGKALLLRSDKNPSQAAGGFIECALMWLVCDERISPTRCAPPATLPSNALVASAHVSHVVFQDLALRYTAGTALGNFMVESLTVHRCDIRWIGGGTRYIPPNDPDCTLGKCVRFGNGIELWMGARNVDIGYNMIEQVYDAGLTNQGEGGAYNQTNITWHHNAISHSEYCFEIWDGSSRNQSSMQDVHFENNTCNNSGGGWSHAARPDKLSAHIKMGKTCARVANISIDGNQFLQSVPISASWSIFDSPYGANTSGWGRSISSNYNWWCQSNASLGPFLVIGCIPGPVRPCLRISINDFEQYYALSQGNGANSTVSLGDCAADMDATVEH